MPKIEVLSKPQPSSDYSSSYESSESEPRSSGLLKYRVDAPVGLDELSDDIGVCMKKGKGSGNKTAKCVRDEPSHSNHVTTEGKGSKTMESHHAEPSSFAKITGKGKGIEKRKLKSNKLAKEGKGSKKRKAVTEDSTAPTKGIKKRLKKKKPVPTKATRKRKGVQDENAEVRNVEVPQKITYLCNTCRSQKISTAFPNKQMKKLRWSDSTWKLHCKACTEKGEAKNKVAQRMQASHHRSTQSSRTYPWHIKKTSQTSWPAYEDTRGYLCDVFSNTCRTVERTYIHIMFNICSMDNLFQQIGNTII